MALPERSLVPRIVRNPRIHGGEPTARGTRVPVRAIVAWRAEPDMATILDEYPRLTAADVSEALAYYETHRAEMDERMQAQIAGA